MSLLLALLLQVGPFVTPGSQSVTPVPPGQQERREVERRKRQAPASLAAPAASSEFGRCLAEVQSDPKKGERTAKKWLHKAKGEQKAEAGHCLGLALVRQQDWGDAMVAFLGARDALAPGNHSYRARLSAMAGNAALAGGQTKAALVALDTAQQEAKAAGEKGLEGQAAMDRSRALVTLGQLGDAEAALVEARQDLPDSGEAWLLSATLSRRMGKFKQAQAQIEKAAQLQPRNPEVGLEAGVIAVLSGHSDAARKSWQSVINSAPNSGAAATARNYLKELGGT